MQGLDISPVSESLWSNAVYSKLSSPMRLLDEFFKFSHFHKRIPYYSRLYRDDVILQPFGEAVIANEAPESCDKAAHGGSADSPNSRITDYCCYEKRCVCIGACLCVMLLYFMNISCLICCLCTVDRPMQPE